MAKERKGYTDEQKAEIKRRRDERNAATRALIEAVIGSKDKVVTEEMLELANLARPKNGGAGSATGTKKVSLMNQVKALFEDKDCIDEITIFNELHVGRNDMAKACKLLIKNFTPETRTWIKFDPEEGEYIVEGRGAEVPEGWTGFVPVEEVVEADTADEQDTADDE